MRKVLTAMAVGALVAGVAVAQNTQSVQTAPGAQSQQATPSEFVNLENKLPTAGAVALPAEIDLVTFLDLASKGQSPARPDSAPATIRFDGHYNNVFEEMRAKQVSDDAEQAAVIYIKPMGERLAYRVARGFASGGRHSVNTYELYTKVRADDGRPLLNIHTHPDDSFFSDSDVLGTIISRMPAMLVTPRNVYITWPSQLALRQTDWMATKAVASHLADRRYCNSLSQDQLTQAFIDLYATLFSTTYKLDGPVFRKVPARPTPTVYERLLQKTPDLPAIVGMLLLRDDVDGMLQKMASPRIASDLAAAAAADRKAFLSSYLKLGAMRAAGFYYHYLQITNGKSDVTRRSVTINPVQKPGGGCDANQAEVTFFNTGDPDGPPLKSYLVTRTAAGFQVRAR